MPLRIPRTFFSPRAFSTTLRPRATLPSNFTPYTLPTQLNIDTLPPPKVGRLGKWYLPTMALLAFLLTPPSILTAIQLKQSSALDSANHKIAFAVYNSYNEHNHKLAKQNSQEERNRLLLASYGSRDSLEDMERAFQGYDGMGEEEEKDLKRRLEKAYGERKSLRDVERALEVYEVQ